MARIELEDDVYAAACKRLAYVFDNYENVYVAFSGAVEEGVWGLVGARDWLALLAGIGAFLLFGFGGAWLLGRALRLTRADGIAMLFSGGQKSIAMGAPLAAILFPPAQAGLVLLPVLCYHLLQLVLSAPLAKRLASSG